jgi:hypothetical protein
MATVWFQTLLTRRRWRVFPAQGDAAAKGFVSSGDLVADMGEVERFLDLVFRHADQTNYISVCCYDHDRSRKPVFKVGIRLNDPQLLDELKSHIARAGRNDTPAVFCPSIATFNSKFSATMQNLAEGVAISVECDERPGEAIRQLREVLGMPTTIIASGGRWTNPETGEVEDKLHAYWRLAVPTRTAEDHAKLRDARALSAKLVGAYASGVSPVHPMRWPGSWHSKNRDRPRLAHIVAANDVEVGLDLALAALREVAGGCGGPRDAVGSGSGRAHETGENGDRMAAEPDKCAYAVGRLADWRTDDRSAWINVGHAIKAAFASDEERGFQPFDQFSRRCPQKYDETDARKRWYGFQPNSIGAGSIYRGPTKMRLAGMTTTTELWKQRSTPPARWTPLQSVRRFSAPARIPLRRTVKPKPMATPGRRIGAGGPWPCPGANKAGRAPPMAQCATRQRLSAARALGADKTGGR